MNLYNVIRKILKILLIVLISVCGLSAVAYFVVKQPKVQAFLAAEITKTLSSKLHTNVSVGDIEFRLFNRLLINDMLIENQPSDTLLFVKKTFVSLSHISFRHRRIRVGTLSVDDAKMRLTSDSTGADNFSHLFGKKDTMAVHKKSDMFDVSIYRFKAKNVVLHYVKTDMPPPKHNTINFNNLYISKFALEADNLQWSDDTLSCNIVQAAGCENSGLRLDKLSGKLRIAPGFVSANDLQIADEYSAADISLLQLYNANDSNFTDFANKAKLSCSLQSAIIDARTLALIMPSVIKTELPVAVNGLLYGEMRDLHARDLQIKMGAKTSASVNGRVWGLPDINRTHFEIEIKGFRSAASEMLLIDSVFNIKKIRPFAKYAVAIDSIGGQAHFAGTIYDCAVSLRLASPAGSVFMEGKLTPFAEGVSHLFATVKAENVQAGRLLKNKDLGLISCAGNIDGKLLPQKKWQMQIKTIVSLLEYKNYDYKSIALNGTLTPQSFLGTAVSTDTNFAFNARTNLTFSPQRQYRFNAKVQRLDLVKIGVNKHDSISQISFGVKGKFSDSEENGISGTANFANIQYVKGEIQGRSASAQFEIAAQQKKKRITLISDIADGEIVTDISWSQITTMTDRFLQHNFPEYKSDSVNAAQCGSVAKTEGGCSFQIKTKQADGLISCFLPQFSVASGTSLSGSINDETINLHLQSDKIQWRNVALQNLTLNATPKYCGTHEIDVSADKLTMGGIVVDSISSKSTLDSSGMYSQFFYYTASEQKDIKIDTRFFVNQGNEKAAVIDIHSTVAAWDNDLWNLQQSRIVIGKNNISVRDFKLENNYQSLQIQGNLSAKHKDSLYLNLKNIEIKPFLRFMGKKNYLSGNLSGSITAQNLLKKTPLFTANIAIDSLVYDNKEVGDVSLVSFIDNQSQNVNFEASVTKHSMKTLTASAVLDKAGNLTGDADFQNAELYFLEYLLTNALSQIHGTGTGKIHISGKPRHILLNGKLDIADCNFVISYLNAKCIADPNATVFDFENSCLKMKNLLLHDTQNNEIRFAAEFNHITTPRNFSYNMNIDTKNTQVLNTTETLNTTYFGQGYATGNVRINGALRRCNISVTADVNPKTNISFALGKKSQQQQEAFINFVQPQKTKDMEQFAPAATTDIHANFNFNITQGAAITIMPSAKTNDIITTNGSGNIRIEMQRHKNIFRVFGNYVIANGEYSISIQNLWNKKFKIQSGSRIDFNGNLENATASIIAASRVRAPLSELFGDTTIRYRQPLPIDCKIAIEGSLLNPAIKFLIDAPTADNEIRDRMQAKLNADNNAAMQFFSLMLVNQFLPSQNSGIVQMSGVSIPSWAIGELLTPMVGNLFSQLLNIDLNLNIKPRSDAYDATDASIMLSRGIGSRLIFSTTLDYQGNRRTADAVATPVSGNVDLEVLVDRAGKLRVRVFGRTNDQYSEMMSGIANNTGQGGMGVMYQEDFNDFGELWNKIFSRKKKPPVN